MKKLLLFLFFPILVFAQSQHTIMDYNLLNYPGNDTTIRNPYFRTTIASVLPDILVCEEMTSQAGVDGFLNNVLLPNYAGYAAGLFINGPDTDCEIYYKSEFFTFISNTSIPTDLRNIYEFMMLENSSGDTLRIYAVHLKASSGTSNEQQRLAEVNVLRSVTDTLPAGSFYMVMGDFNIYGSAEPAYTALLNQATPGYFVDLFNLTGTWNNASYAPYHTQSTRTRQFGGGANGGLDDRFDMILMSQSIIDAGGIDYVSDSYIPYGNDGQHYNDSINQPPNLAVGQEIADALHYSSDHLPVIAGFSFQSITPVELLAFNAFAQNDEVQLSWSTATETNNSGFEIQRNISAPLFSAEQKGWVNLAFVDGFGSSALQHHYTFTDKNLTPGNYQYRLKQIDYDGSYHYSNIASAQVIGLNQFLLYQNYPNPFNPTTMIDYYIPVSGNVQLKIYNILSQEVAAIVNGYQVAGKHSIVFDAGKLTSGIYFYKLQAGNNVQIKKMILLK